MFDPSLECPIVCFAHDQIYVPGIVIEEGLAQGRAISDGGVVCLSFRYRQQHQGLTGKQLSALALQARCVPSSLPRTAD